MSKPRKTRIKINTLADGTLEYTPQHKGWLFWYDFDDSDGISMFVHTNPIGYRQNSTSLISAQTQIDEYIAAFHKEDIRRNGITITKTEYVKYP